MTPRRLRWGLTFVLVGIVLLLVNMGRLYPLHERELVQLLPYILIGIGIEKIFTSTRFEILSYISVVATVGVVSYALFQGMPGFLEHEMAIDAPIVIASDASVHRIDASLKMSSAQLTMRSTRTELFHVDKPDYWGFPEFDHSIKGDELVIDLNTDRRSTPGVRVDFDGTNSTDWEMGLAENCSNSLSLDLDEVDAHLNLAELQLTKLDIQGNDCDLYVKVGDKQPESVIDIYGESNRVKLRLPSHSGVRIRGYDDDSYFESLGLTRSGGAYINHEYETATNKIDIALDESLSSLNIDFY